MKITATILAILVSITFTKAQVYTDFENDSLDGWRSEGDGSYYLEYDFGNPGSCMRVDDDATGDLNIAIAPVTYLGDWSDADTTDSLMADIYISLLNGSQMPNLWAFRISGPGGSAIGPIITPPLGQWNHVAIALDSAQWNVSTGTWQALLDYVSHVEVRAEYINGDEFVRLDNIALTFSPVIVPIHPPVISDFEGGLYEGWTFEQSGGTSIPASDGNPGRYVRITDGTGLTQAIAPPKFLGDWTALNGAAAIQFDIKITNFTGPLILSDFWIKISGPGGQALVMMDSTITGSFNQWKTFSFLISQNEWTITSGGWNALLEDIRELRLLVEYINGSEIVCFDNFRITNSPPVAEFVAEPLFVFLGQEVRFRDLSLNAPDSWYWEFGDDNSSSEAAPVHQYQEAGKYDIGLTVYNYFGSDFINKESYIEVAGISDSILFADDFNDNEIHPAWSFRNGTWVEQNQTMVQSSNYYSSGYIGGCYALVGSPLWKNYQLRVDFRSTDNDKIGVVFNYQDVDNFYLFTWQQEGTHRAIKRFIDGVQTDLVVDTLGYEMNQWYNLMISTMDGNIRVEIDSVEIFSISDPTFLNGKAGLYCHGNQSSIWDNFQIINLDYVSAIQNEVASLSPKTFRLMQNYPNPFNPKTVISWQLAVGCHVELNIYTILGQKVKTLISEKQEAGFHTMEWDAGGLASGVYLYRLTTDQGFLETKKLILIR